MIETKKLKPGDIVNHSRFNEGKIISIDQNYVTIMFREHGQKKISISIIDNFITLKENKIEPIIKPQENNNKLKLNRDEIVIHTKFGEGKIVSFDEKYINILFGEDGMKKLSISNIQDFITLKEIDAEITKVNKIEEKLQANKTKFIPGEIVIHKTLMEGRIINTEDNYATIVFQEGGIKKISLETIDEFLTLKDGKDNNILKREALSIKVYRDSRVGDTLINDNLGKGKIVDINREFVVIDFYHYGKVKVPVSEMQEIVPKIPVEEKVFKEEIKERRETENSDEENQFYLLLEKQREEQEKEEREKIGKFIDDEEGIFL